MNDLEILDKIVDVLKERTWANPEEICQPFGYSKQQIKLLVARLVEDKVAIISPNRAEILNQGLNIGSFAGYVEGDRVAREASNNSFHNITVVGANNTIGNIQSSRILDNTQDNKNIPSAKPKKTSGKDIFIDLTKIIGATLVLGAVVYKFFLEIFGPHK